MDNIFYSIRNGKNPKYSYYLKSYFLRLLPLKAICRKRLNKILAQTDPNRCAVLCANLGGDTDTIGAMATAICGALHGVNAIDPALKAELDAVNQLDFNRYATALAKYRQQREAV